MDYYLGVDAGGSHTRAALATSKGEIVGVGRAGPANFRTRPLTLAAGEIQAAVEMAVRPHRVERVCAVCIGSAGLEHPEDEGLGRRLLGSVIAADAVILDTDAYIGWAGALAGQPGIVVIAGTGSICMGVDEQGHRYRVGGWGPRFGDEGSAYDIAVKGVRRALEVLDGRSEDSEFLSALLTFSGVAAETPEDTARALTAWLYGASQTASTIARFAGEVNRLALAGNQGAREILQAAGRDLAGLVHAVKGRLSVSPPVRVSIGGGVLQHSQPVRSALEACLNRAGGYHLIAPAAPAVVGALLIALRSRSSSLPEAVVDGLIGSGAAMGAEL